MERLLIKFTKNNGAKFISHLDTQRTLHRAFRRAELPISYSKGFNPHASISVAAPLSLGIESIAEYADVEMDSDVESDAILKALNDALPNDIKISNVVHVSGKMPAAMAAVACAKYSFHFDMQSDIEVARETIRNILEDEEIIRMKRSKSGEKLVNIRPLIKDITYETFENGVIKFICYLQAGSNGSISPDAVAQLINEYSNNRFSGHPYIKREEIYTYVNDKKIPLDRYYSGK